MAEVVRPLQDYLIMGDRPIGARPVWGAATRLDLRALGRRQDFRYYFLSLPFAYWPLVIER